MKVALTVNDFLDRAVTVYGDRPGLVDEPDQPAESRGELTFAESGRVPGPRRPGSTRSASPKGERVVFARKLGPPAHVLLRGVGLRSGPRADQLPTLRRRGRVHRRALRSLGADRRPRARRGARGGGVQATLRDRGRVRRGPLPARPRPEPWHYPDEDATATINYTSGTTARPKGVQLTHRNCRATLPGEAPSSSGG